MHNYTNMSGVNTNMNIKAFEISEAKKKMGTSSYTPNSMGMTSSLNTYTNLSSLNSVPDLNSSTSVGYTEIENAKNKMNNGSSTNSMF